MGINIMAIIFMIISGMFGTYQKYQHGKSQNKLKDKENEIEKIQLEKSSEIDKLKLEHLLEIEKIRMNHEKEIQQQKHEFNMEMQKYTTEVNTNSLKGIKEVAEALQLVGIDSKDMVNNPEKFKKQVNNMNTNNYINKKGKS